MHIYAEVKKGNIFKKKKERNIADNWKKNELDIQYLMNFLKSKDGRSCRIAFPLTIVPILSQNA